jgi:hypothetical protein
VEWKQEAGGGAAFVDPCRSERAPVGVHNDRTLTIRRATSTSLNLS